MKISEGKKQSVKDKISEYMSSIAEADDGQFKDKILGYIKDRQESIDKFIAPGKSENIDHEYTLTVLRKWNSYTPVLPNEKDSFSNKGGGYFLRVKNYGIVVDPGYNFIESFMLAGFKLDDIDCIFISHAHNDHTVELESIFSLLYKRNIDLSYEDSQKIKLFMNLGTFKKFSGYFDLSDPKDNYYIDDIVILNKYQTINVNNSIRVYISEVKHHEMISKNFAVGFIFQILDDEEKYHTVKFTCDTGWDSKIQKKNKDIASEQLEKIGSDNGDVDILVAHIGSIKEIEFSYDVNKSLAENELDKKLYKNHLGMIGVIAAVDFWKPYITLVSEFGQEMNAIRNDIANILCDKLEKKVIATDLNFCLDIQSKNIKCFLTKDFFPFDLITTQWDNDQIYYYNENELGPGQKPEVSKMLGKEISVF